MISRTQRCPNCDAKVKRGARWCHNCGTELPQPVVAPTADAPAETTAHVEGRDPNAEMDGRMPPEAVYRDPSEKTTASRLSLALVVVLVLAVVATGLVISGAASGTVAPNGQETSAAARAAILDRVRTALPPAFTYTATTLSSDMANAEKAMTPAQAKKYANLLSDDARKGIADRGQAQTAKVEADGMISLTGDTAKVLVLIVETTTATGVTTQQIQASRVRVTMKKSGGTWLIDAMDPF